MRSLAIIWHRLGPYHIARLRAMATVAAVTAVEMSSEIRAYAWDHVVAQDGFDRVTIFPDSDCDDMRPTRVARKLCDALTRIAPDVVVIPSWGANYALAALHWSLTTGTPNVVMTDSSAADKPRHPSIEWAKRRVVRGFQAGFVGGIRSVEYLETLGIPRERSFCGCCVVDNRHFETGALRARSEKEAIRRELSLPPRFLLCTCRFIWQKNLPMLFRAFAKSLATRDGWHLVVIGDGVMRSELEALRRELRMVGLIHMPGFKQYHELPNFYALADAFILASISETWGLVVNEAMASGLPVLVTHRAGCTPELVHDGVNGFGFDPRDVDEMSSLISRVTAMQVGQLARMGEASRTIIARWTPETFRDGLSRAMTVAIEQGPPTPSVINRVLLPMLMSRRNKAENENSARQ